MPESPDDHDRPKALFEVAENVASVENLPIDNVVPFPAVTRLPELPLNRPDEAVDVPLASVDPGAALFEYMPDEPRQLATVVPVPVPASPKPRTTGKPKSPEGQARGVLANELAKVYTRRVKLSKVPAVAAVVRKALEDNWTPEEIDRALNGLADKKQFVTVGTILYELRANAVHTDNRPRFDPKVRRGGKPVETAVYRFYNADDVLLYVGQTPALLERFFEHRDDKPWFHEVDHWSREFHPTREEAEWREDFVIADEWPQYNKKGQPRDGDGYRVPSYVTAVLLQVIRDAVGTQVPEVRPEQINAVAAHVAAQFDVQHSHREDRITYGMRFGQSSAPTEFFPMDLDKARENHGPYRADVNGSLRVPRAALPVAPSAGATRAVSLPKADSAPVEPIRKPGEAVVVTLRLGRAPLYDEAHYREVAAIYNAAVSKGQSPIKAVMEKFGKSKGAVSNWVYRCRHVGLLPPTTPGRAAGYAVPTTDSTEGAS